MIRNRLVTTAHVPPRGRKIYNSGPKKHQFRVAAVALVGFASFITLVPRQVQAQGGAIAAVGRALFFDTTLSNPPGMACASCHDPDAGFTYPDSDVNEQFGPVPGIVAGRFGNRKPPTISYAKYIPSGPPFFSSSMGSYVGGLFWDGRANVLSTQIPFPLLSPNEMNNDLHGVEDPELAVQKVANGASAKLFEQAFGAHVFSLPSEEVFQFICQAIAAYEQSAEVSPFTSKYDAFLTGKATLNASELNGLRLITGSLTGRPGGRNNSRFAQCVLCHGIPSSPSAGPDLWTNSCYANIGVPKNPNNPYYNQTNAAANPLGYNPAGRAYIDLGLGGTYYPMRGLPPGNMGQGSNGRGDILLINGTFKAPTLRNVDKRPTPSFVRAYMHNGSLKSLKQVVHFYNTRNLTSIGEVINFNNSSPYAKLKGTPLWPAPEFPAPMTLQNASGASGRFAVQGSGGGEAGFPAQVGNLGLTDQEENDIVAFLQALTDGFFEP
jgi:cytochrome c peroxidase